MKPGRQFRIYFLFLSLSFSSSLSSIKPIPVEDAVNYRTDISVSIDDRIQDAPAVLLKYLSELDKTENYKNYSLNNAEKGQFRNYFKLMPKLYQNTANSKVIGIFFVENFRTAGMTHYVFSERDGLFLALIFNPDILKTSIADWLAYRDRSAAEPDDQLKVEVNISSDFTVLLYTLVHELSHVVDIYYKAQAFPWPTLKYAEYSSILPAANIWQAFYLTKKNNDFANRKKIRPYGLGMRLTSKELIAVYKVLPQRPYVSAYAAMSSGEDFAETFSVCFLKEYHDLEYRVDVFYAGQKAATFTPSQSQKIKERCQNVLHFGD